MADSVTRYVVTHISRLGCRILTFPKQGRYTYANPEKAREALDALLDVEANGNDIAGVYGSQAVGSFEVRPIPCYPGHFDPKTCWFD